LAFVPHIFTIDQFWLSTLTSSLVLVSPLVEFGKRLLITGHLILSIVDKGIVQLIKSLVLAIYSVE
jgi:hypothetical protein